MFGEFIDGAAFIRGLLMFILLPFGLRGRQVLGVLT
jgi:hypothetical protein